jgi:hypothetical protein
MKDPFSIWCVFLLLQPISCYSCPCVTPWFREDETEASIYVLRMFKSHVLQQYGEQIQYLNKLQAKILQNDHWIRKKITIKQPRKSKCRCDFHRHNRRRGRPSLHLLALAGTLDSLNRLMVVTQQVGEKYDMKAINKEGLTLGFDLQKAVVNTYALINLVNR